MFPTRVFPTALFPARAFPRPSGPAGTGRGAPFPRSVFPRPAFPAALFPGGEGPTSGRPGVGPFPRSAFPRAAFPPALFPGGTGAPLPVGTTGGLFPAGPFPAALFPRRVFPGPTPLLPTPTPGDPGCEVFPRGLFPPALFPVLAFPGGPTPTSPVGPVASILDAVHARIDATAALRAILGDRHWDVVTPQPGGAELPAPYLVLTDRGVTSEYRTTGRRSVRTTGLLASYVGTSAADGWAFVDAFRRAFRPRMSPLYVPGKTYLSTWVGRPRTASRVYRAPSGSLRVEMQVPMAVTFAEDY